MKRHVVICLGAAIFLAGILAPLAPALASNELPFKQTNIHFETNASACDMGIQMSFDTEGITVGEVENPYGDVVFSIGAVLGQEGTDDITEIFQERVEPPIWELLEALDCEPPEDDAIYLSELLAAWPAGWYKFRGESGGEEFEGKARLTYRIPAGPEVTAPEDGDVVPHDQHLHITWEKVDGPIAEGIGLGPVEVVGYHVVVDDVTDSEPFAPGVTKTVLDVDLAAGETSLLVPKQFLEPGRIYEFEVLATEKRGNETITEGGVFCTPPISPESCEAP